MVLEADSVLVAAESSGGGCSREVQVMMWGLVPGFTSKRDHFRMVRLGGTSGHFHFRYVDYCGRAALRVWVEQEDKLLSQCIAY